MFREELTECKKKNATKNDKKYGVMVIGFSCEDSNDRGIPNGFRYPSRSRYICNFTRKVLNNILDVLNANDRLRRRSKYSDRNRRETKAGTNGHRYVATENAVRIKTTTRSKLSEKKECFVGSIKDINVSEATTSSEHLLYGPIIHMTLFYEDATNIQEAAIHLVYSLDPIACTIQTNKDITFEDQNVQRNNTTVPTTTSSMTVPTISTTLWSTTTSKNFTEKTTTSQTDRTPVFTGNTSLTTESSVATTKITIPPPTPIPPPIWTPTPTSNLTSKTTDGIITVPSTQSTTTSMRSTTMPMQSTTQCVSNITYPSSTTASPSIFTDSNTNVTDPSTTEENISKITPIFNYILRDDTGVACVLANMTIHILESMLTVPTDATTTGICVGKTANMTLSWEETVKSYNNKKNKITFNYSHDNSKFFLDSIFVDLHEKRMIGNATARHRLFSAAIKDGIFICETSTMINVENKINIDISDIYLIVFNECFNNCRKTVQLKDELKGFNRGRKNSFAKSVFFLARRDMSFLFLLRPWKYENLVKSNNKNILEYTYMKNSRKDKSHSEVLEKDNLLYVKSAASCASSRDVQCLRRGWNFKIFRASATQRQLFAHIPFILPGSMYRWLLNTRSIVQLLSLVLPLPT
ncbi:ZAN protein, partial [Acromyrmex charruanus]